MMDSASLVVYINGEYVPQAEAKISIFDFGFLRGDAVFDTMSAWKGSIFKLDAHIRRLYNSLRVVRIPISLTPEELKRAIIETTRRCGLHDAYIQCIVTRGLPPAGERDLLRCTPTVIIFAIPYVWILSPEKIQQGARVKIASTRSIPPQCLDPRIKSLDRLHFDLAILEAKAAGMDETIMLDVHGHVTEGPGFNVFLVKGGTIYTPPEGILQGITRQTVFEIAAEQGIETQVTPLTAYDLFAGDEVFLSSTAGGIMPVVEIDGRSIGDGKPGPISRKIHAAYWKMRESGRHSTPVFSPAEA
ncbi:MAG: branched-chain amino acid aminotransferase [Nitrospinota bacterium]|nr:MAG: branched-chain amino acid aminotransferase [Nitrospinota bacterium]